MKKFLLWTLFAALSLNHLAAQSAKSRPPVQGPELTPEQLQLRPWPGKSAVPQAPNPFGLSRTGYKTQPPLALSPATAEDVQTTRGENGLPIFFQGKTAVSEADDAGKTAGERAIDYLASLKPAAIAQPAGEFRAKSTETDEQGNLHVRLEQYYQGVPVYGGEVIAHTKKGAFEMLNGRYYPTPTLTTVTPALSSGAAIQKVAEHYGPGKVKTNWTDDDRQLIGGAESKAELVVYHVNRDLNAERLAWHVVFYPNLLRREVFFVDAQTGEMIHHFDHTCEIHPAQGTQTTTCGETSNSGPEYAPLIAPATPTVACVDGPVPATGLDLLNQNRSFGAWMSGSTIYLEDAGRAMFNAGASNMPSSPVGAIVTLTAKNTSPEVQTTFDYDLVTSASATFSDKNAVSAHWNAIQSYEYYRGTHSRKSIDDVNGNIISFINVANDNGSSMENAFWNGAAMWYGNGGSFFNQLARGLDVGGHEMTHGVIEKTANLEYQDESGALNESFADVFAVCIDRNDWQIGEDVVKAGATPNNCLRDLQDPHKGSPAQPNHVNEQVSGPQDNGGVHVNSGIPNRAFYLFASNAAVGIDKAEKVYYKALRDYLVKSSQFVDCRLAVIQAANDLYGNTVANAAATAFTTVGIVGNQGGDYQGDLAVNPGSDLILCATNDLNNAQLALSNGTVLGTLYDQGIACRPSATDDGKQVVFVNTAGHIIGVDLTYNMGGTIDFQYYELTQTPDWRSAAISKDGQYIAALSKTENNRIYIYELAVSFSPYTFFLYNPTYSETPQITGEVRYADVLEFDYTGEYLMYDAFNELNNGDGEDLSYWDIGFLRFRENGEFVDGATAFISKLFSGLPEKASIGNPTFAKNSPYIIAFDFIDGLNDRYDVLGANTETGDVDYLASDNDALGWPSYTRLDDAVLYERPVNNTTNIYKRGISTNKITGLGTAALLIQDRNWGVWFANGSRSLMVDADEVSVNRLQLTAAPNPATDAVRLSFTAERAGPGQVVVYDLLGRTMVSREWSLNEGLNQIELGLQGLPLGTYTVRLVVNGDAAALKVMKQ